jgi:hypothetical protein
VLMSYAMWSGTFFFLLRWTCRQRIAIMPGPVQMRRTGCATLPLVGHPWDTQALSAPSLPMWKLLPL